MLAARLEEKMPASGRRRKRRGAIHAGRIRPLMPCGASLSGGLEEMDQRDQDPWAESHDPPDPPDDGSGECPPFLSEEFDLQEALVEKSLRPRRFEDFVGQRRVVENLRTAINAARARGEVLAHVLLSAMPGLGKTPLALLVAQAMEVNIQETSGPVIERGKDLAGHLTTLRRGDVLFIDEIHRMSREAEEYLYSAMEDFKMDIRLDKGPEARSIRFTMAPFTLVGATTREGLLAAPFRGRFGILEKLEPYEEEDLAEIVLRSAAILGVRTGREAARRIAQRSRGTPRFANRFLKRVRDVAQEKLG